RHPGGAQGAAGGRARIWHGAGADVPAGDFPGDAAAGAAGLVEPLAHRHQGHGAAGGRRLQRIDAGDAAGGRLDAGLFHLLPRGRGALPADDAGFWPGLRRARGTFPPRPGGGAGVTGWLRPHRVALIALALLLALWAAWALRWDWIARYWHLGAQGLWRTLWLLVLSVAIGFALAVPLGLAQAAGPRWLA